MLGFAEWIKNVLHANQELSITVKELNDLDIARELKELAKEMKLLINMLIQLYNKGNLCLYQC